MRRLVLLALVVLFSVSHVHAKDVTIKLLDQNGQGVADAVVTFHPATSAGRPAVSPSTNTHAINQKDTQFIPFMTIVPKSRTVTFFNEDSVLHHVFSFSAAKRFSLKLFGKSDPQKVEFDQSGVIVLGCNIHDNMIAYVKVVETPFAGKTNADGTVTLGNLPDTQGQLRIWHPLMKGRGNELRTDLESPSSAPFLEFKQKFRRGATLAGEY